MYLKLITNTPHPQFDVYDQEGLALSIKIDAETDGLRVSCKNKRRVFFIAEEKLRKSSVYNLLNEYSQPLGTLVKDKQQGNSGEVYIEGLRLQYQLTSNPLNEIVILENNTDPVLNCRLSDSLISEYSDFTIYFIFALSWFTFLSKERQEATSLAEA